MTDTRLTLRQAAAVLNVSESAIRKRVERGTLRSDKGADGKRYVYLDTVADNMADEGADASATPEHDALISELRAHNDTLREQLEAERQAHAEARRIIAGLVERIPAIEAPQEASEAAETVEEEPERAEPPSRGQEPSEEVDLGQEEVGVEVVGGARRRSNAKGPPVQGGASVVEGNTLLTSIVPLPVEYERDPYMPRYVRDKRMLDDPVIVHIATSPEPPTPRIRYSDWPTRLRRWRAKVYVLGILVTMLFVVTDFADTHLVGVGALGEVLTHRLFAPFVFGLYVGMKEVHQPGWWRLHIVGLLAGILAGLFSYAGWVYLFGSAPEPMKDSAEPIDWAQLLVDMLFTYVLGTWLVFVSGVLLGKGVQQKAEQERWGAQNVADAFVQQGQGTGAGTARTWTILGLVVALAAALMQSIATVLAAALFGGN